MWKLASGFSLSFFYLSAIQMIWKPLPETEDNSLLVTNRIGSEESFGLVQEDSNCGKETADKLFYSKFLQPFPTPPQAAREANGITFLKYLQNLIPLKLLLVTELPQQNFGKKKPPRKGAQFSVYLRNKIYAAAFCFWIRFNADPSLNHSI